MDRKRLGIAVKAKYQNVLPPPPFPPKLVEYDLSAHDLLTAGSLSAIFLQKPLEPEVDTECGMPIDYAQAYLDLQGSSEPGAALSAADAELLEEPVVSGLGATPSAGSVSAEASHGLSMSYREGTGATDIGIGTSFLRRTAYMSSDTRRSMRRATSVADDKRDIASELKRIEDGFRAARAPLEELRHPNKPHLTAVKAMPLLPDLKDSDLTFLDVRFVGSASLANLPEVPDEVQLRASVLRRVHVEDEDEGLNEEWLSLFVPGTESDASALAAYRTDLRDTLPAAEARQEEEALFQMYKVQENNMQTLRPAGEIEEIVLTQASDGSAVYYSPIAARVNLSRRRVDVHTQELLQSQNADILDLHLRELTPEESVQRDEVRSMYDPVNFG